MSEVLDKIRKLLALARDASATPGEVEAALGRAAHLQRLHGITEEQVARHVSRDANNEVRIDAKAVERRTIWTGRRIGRWHAWTASAMAMAAGCATFHSHGAQGSIIAYGLPQDLAVCQELFAFGMATGERLQVEWARANFHQRQGREAKSWRDGFCMGLHEAARRAVAESKTDQAPVPTGEKSAPGMALVVVTAGALVVAKERAVAAFRGTLNLRSGSGHRGTAGGSYSAHSAGRATGAAQNLTRRAVR